MYRSIDHFKLLRMTRALTSNFLLQPSVRQTTTVLTTRLAETTTASLRVSLVKSCAAVAQNAERCLTELNAFARKALRVIREWRAFRRFATTTRTVPITKPATD